MNRDYILKLIEKKRVGKIIKLIKLNIFNWSIRDFKYILKKSLRHDIPLKKRLHDLAFFVIEEICMQKKVILGLKYVNPKMYNPYYIEVEHLLETMQRREEYIDYDLVKYAISKMSNVDYKILKLTNILSLFEYFTNNDIYKYFTSKDIQRIFYFTDDKTYNAFYEIITSGNRHDAEVYFTRDAITRLYDFDPAEDYFTMFGELLEFNKNEILRFLIRDKNLFYYPQLGVDNIYYRLYEY